MHTHKHTYMHTHTHARTHAHAHSRTRTHARTRTRTHTRTHTCTHAHTHSRVLLTLQAFLHTLAYQLLLFCTTGMPPRISKISRPVTMASGSASYQLVDVPVSNNGARVSVCAPLKRISAQLMLARALSAHTAHFDNSAAMHAVSRSQHMHMSQRFSVHSCLYIHTTLSTRMHRTSDDTQLLLTCTLNTQTHAFSYQEHMNTVSRSKLQHKISTHLSPQPRVWFQTILWQGKWVRLAKTAYLHRVFGDFCQKYGVYTVYVWFWPTPQMSINHLELVQRVLAHYCFVTDFMNYRTFGLHICLIIFLQGDQQWVPGVKQLFLTICFFKEGLSQSGGFSM